MISEKYIGKVFRDAAKVSHLTVQIGESPLLRQKSQEVPVTKINSPEIKKVISDLKKTLREYRRLTGKGRGVAAVQIGIPLRITVLYINKKQVVLINPEITGRSTRFLEYPEICMSSNPIVAKVVRPAWVEVSYLNESGKKRIWDEKDDLILNRVFQHEIDHLDGILNIDLIRPGNLIFDSDPDFFKNAGFKEKEMGR